MKKDPRDDIRKVVDWHFTCIAQGLPTNFTPIIVGPSGSGKTYSIKKAIEEAELTYFPGTKIMRVPLITIDATILTAEGWVGSSLEKEIVQQLSQYKYAKHAIIYVDEIDKIVTSKSSNDYDGKIQLQSNFLKWLDGDYLIDKYCNGSRVECTTAQITFMFSGAFEGILQEKARKDKSIGFDATVKPKDIYKYDVTWEDLEKWGYLKEFINRMNILIQTRPYSKDKLKTMCRESYDRAFIQDMLGVRISPENIAKKAMSSGSGARGLTKEMYQQALNGYKLEE